MNILTAYPKVSIIIIALAVTFISSLITKFLKNQEHLHSLKKRQKELQEEIKKRCVKKVLLQLPEGLKPQALRLADVIEKAGAQAIAICSPSRQWRG